MEIKNKTPNDPVASLYLVDAYMRWALLAAEEVVGTLKKGALWLTGKDFDVEEVEGRALGAPACV